MHLYVLNLQAFGGKQRISIIVCFAWLTRTSISQITQRSVALRAASRRAKWQRQTALGERQLNYTARRDEIRLRATQRGDKCDFFLPVGSSSFASFYALNLFARVSFCLPREPNAQSVHPDCPPRPFEYTRFV